MPTLVELPEPSFPEHVSNSQRKLFVTCPQKWYYSYCRGLRKAEGRSVDLVAGGALARGLEVARKSFFDEGFEEYPATEAGVKALTLEYGEDLWPDHPKNRSRTMGALYAYFKNWPLGDDYLTPHKFVSGAGVESRFAIPLPIQHPYLPQPMLYEGRIDLIATHQSYGEALWIVDDKLTKTLGAGWRKQWALDAQPTSYVWAAQQMGFPVAGAIIRGTSCLSKGYGHEEAIALRNDSQVADWYQQLLWDVERMIATFRQAKLHHEHASLGRRPDRALDASACNAYYRECAFLQPCSSINPEEWLRAMIQPLPETPTDTLDAIFGEF